MQIIIFEDKHSAAAKLCLCCPSSKHIRSSRFGGQERRPLSNRNAPR